MIRDVVFRAPKLQDPPTPALIHAVNRGSASVVEAMIKAGADVNIRNPKVMEPGHGCLPLITLRCEAGQQQDGSTALQAAAGRVAIRDALIKAGANVDAVDDSHGGVDSGSTGTATEVDEDALKWDYQQYPPGYFDVIWASPPCTQYSQARTTGGPPDLPHAHAIVHQTLEIFYFLQPDHWFMENPRGRYPNALRFRPVIQRLPLPLTCNSVYGQHVVTQRELSLDLLHNRLAQGKRSRYTLYRRDYFDNFSDIVGAGAGAFCCIGFCGSAEAAGVFLPTATAGRSAVITVFLGLPDGGGDGHVEVQPRLFHTLASLRVDEGDGLPHVRGLLCNGARVSTAESQLSIFWAQKSVGETQGVPRGGTRTPALPRGWWVITFTQAANPVAFDPQAQRAVPPGATDAPRRTTAGVVYRAYEDWPLGGGKPGPHAFCSPVGECEEDEMHALGLCPVNQQAAGDGPGAFSHVVCETHGASAVLHATGREWELNADLKEANRSAAVMNLQRAEKEYQDLRVEMEGKLHEERARWEQALVAAVGYNCPFAFKRAFE
eukprot:gene7746-biopygen7825